MPLEEYLFIDDNVIVVEYPIDTENLANLNKRYENEDNDASFDDISETVLIAHQPSNKEIHIMLKKCSKYMCSKESASNELSRFTDFGKPRG